MSNPKAAAQALEPSVEQLDQILAGLQRSHTRESAREFLRVWIRDWTTHKAALEQPESGGVCGRCGGWVCDPVLELEQPEPLPERELFEHWAQEQRLALNRHAHSYASTATAWCWDAWAARAALAQQEQTITPAELSAALGWPGGISTPVLGKVELLRMVASAALAQQEQATGKESLQVGQEEPVAMRYDYDGHGYLYIDSGSGSDWQTRHKDAEPLYTNPPRREWQSLTEEEVWSQYQTLWPFHPAEEPRLAADISKFARAIEQALKEKNHATPLASQLAKPVAWMLTDKDNPNVRFLEWQPQTRPYRGEWIKTPLYVRD